MAIVKQVRVLRNVGALFALCAVILGLLRDQLGTHSSALALGMASGLAYGVWRWKRLQGRITRQNRRYERNKIFVHYLSGFEAVVAAVMHNVYLAIPLGLAALAAVLFAALSAHWWTVLGSSFGLASMGVLAGCILGYEHREGPLYYQYESTGWSGAEGLLYQPGTVVQDLAPTGKVTVDGVLWNAVSLSGEPIRAGERIEVISVERLTLYVDRLPETDRATAS